MPLKPEFKQSTLDALRSGNYRQQAGSAGTFGGRKCCIAVAAVANGISFAEGGQKDFYPYLLTDLCARFIGLTAMEQYRWQQWNDVDRLNFREIANRIEKEF